MVSLLSSAQLEGTMRRAMVQLVQLGFFQSGLFLLALAVFPPAQTSLEPPKGDACAPKPGDFSALSTICIATGLSILSSMAAAMLPIQNLTENKPLDGEGRSLGTVRYLRAAGCLAVVLSMLTMGLGLALSFKLLLVKTTRVSCWSTAKYALVITSLAGASLVFLVYYTSTLRVVFSTEVPAPAPAPAPAPEGEA